VSHVSTEDCKTEDSLVLVVEAVETEVEDEEEVLGTDMEEDEAVETEVEDEEEVLGTDMEEELETDVEEEEVVEG